MGCNSSVWLRDGVKVWRQWSPSVLSIEMYFLLLLIFSTICRSQSQNPGSSYPFCFCLPSGWHSFPLVFRLHPPWPPLTPIANRSPWLWRTWISPFLSNYCSIVLRVCICRPCQRFSWSSTCRAQTIASLCVYSLYLATALAAPPCRCCPRSRSTALMILTGAFKWYAS